MILEKSYCYDTFIYQKQWFMIIYDVMQMSWALREYMLKVRVNIDNEYLLYAIVWCKQSSTVKSKIHINC